MKSIDESLNIYNVEDRIVEFSQWLVVFGIFFANRIEVVCIILASIIIGVYRKTIYTSAIIKYMLAVFIVSFVTIIMLGYNYEKFLQQAVLLSIFLLCYEQFYYHNEDYILQIFLKYVKLCFYISIIGLLQELLFLMAGMNIAELMPFYHQTLEYGGILRVTSTLSEGGYLGTILIPCLVYLFFYNDPFNVLGIKKYFVLIVSLLTFSPFVYIFLVALVLSKLTNKLKHVKFISIISLIGIILYGTTYINSKEYDDRTGGLEGIMMRVKDTISLIDILSEDNLEDIVMLNTSTAVMYTNFYVSMTAPSRIIGTGLGTHEQNHKKIVSYNFDERYSFTQLNAEDGYSLMVRLLSEMGICGLILYILFVVHFFNKGNFLNVSIFFIICCFFIRGGSYVDFGTIFFHFAYFYTSTFNLRIDDVKIDYNNNCYI